MLKKELVTLKIAGFIIEIIFIKSQEQENIEEVFVLLVKEYYKNFIFNQNSQKPDFRLQVVNNHNFNILKKRNKKSFFINLYEEKSNKVIETFYHISTSHFQLIIRKITHDLLLKSGGFIVHASAAKVRNKAIIFLGNSGAGKSTIVTLLNNEFIPLGDDTVLIKKEEDTYYCYTSSAIEKNGWVLKSIKRHELSKAYFLIKSKSHNIKPIISKEEVIQLITAQIYSEEGTLSKHFKNVVSFVNEFKQFKYLHFSLENKQKLSKLIYNGERL